MASRVLTLLPSSRSTCLLGAAYDCVSVTHLLSSVPFGHACEDAILAPEAGAYQPLLADYCPLPSYFPYLPPPATGSGPPVDPLPCQIGSHIKLAPARMIPRVEDQVRGGNLAGPGSIQQPDA